MKSLKIFSIFIFALTLITSVMTPAHADPYGPAERRFGLGLVAGDPTGVTGKFYLANNLAIDGYASWSFIDESLTLMSNLLYTFAHLPIDSSSLQFPVYLGAGARLGFDKGGKNDDKTLFGARIPVGTAIHWDEINLEVYAEIAPGVEMIPQSEFDLTGGIGIRYYF